MPAPDFSTFPEVSKADWLAAVQKQLKGKDPATLGIEVEGTRVDPFAHPDDRPEAQPPVPVPGRWTVSERLVVGEELSVANQQLLTALNGGVQAPEIELSRVLDTAQWQTLFDGVEAAYIDVHIVDGAGDEALLHKLNTALGADWTGTVQSGKPQESESAGVRTLGCTLTNDYDEAAAVSQLGDLYQQTQWHLAAAPDKSSAAGQLHYRVPVGRKYLVAIAKLRALRILVAQACAAYGLTNVPLPIIAAYAHPQTFDEQPYTNLIRWGSLALSAVAGGADRVIAPQLPTTTEVTGTFNARIARNALHVLQLEGGVAEVHDPAAGSFYLEQLTDQLVAAVGERLG